MFRVKKNNAKLNVNSTHTMGWKEKTKQNSRASEMRASMYRSKETLNSRSIYLAVILPDKPIYYVEDAEHDEEEINDWMAENTVEFYNEVQLLYSSLAESNEAWAKTCALSVAKATVGYPKNVKYMWKAGRDMQPRELAVDSYIDHVILWIASQIENEEVFPADEEIPFPANFHKHVKKICQRMFRIFAIIYSNESLLNGKASNNHLDSCFKHFMYFVMKWGLLEAKEWKCIDHVVNPIIKKYYRDEKLYMEQKLPLDENVHDDK